ncbi:MAG TPA: low molecular weight phosphatase family protein [Mycobacterium sp.]|nr:low molecular weight phosphatase family protein [Mycobacterium sp.]HPZ94741.1 low molecular weight phosphatase family protein [Mycobacterium sp.]HQE15506.1 low molecular weight phosphatase family protein [Mycobacterium sp.]
MHILFVCTGNICRSPTAERLAAGLAMADIRASSAGTRAVIAHPMHPEAAQALLDLGGDPTGFSARQLTPAIATDADLVIAMTRAHRDAVLELAPRQLHRTFILTEAAALTTQFEPADLGDLSTLRPQLRADDLEDIADPIGKTPEVYAEVAEQIAALVAPVVEFCRRVFVG